MTCPVFLFISPMYFFKGTDEDLCVDFHSVTTAILFARNCHAMRSHSSFLLFIIAADISTVLCDKQNKAEALLQNREKGQTPVLKTIVVMDSFDAELVTRGAACGVDILSMEDVEVSASGLFVFLD